MFQLTAARRRLGCKTLEYGCINIVSTHSRPKAAGQVFEGQAKPETVSTHSRPKAAGYHA